MYFPKGRLTIIAGPCAVESESQVMEICEYIKGRAHIFRGGAFKPRTNPNSFHGLGWEGLGLLQHVRKHMPVITEATQVNNLIFVAEHTDIIQIGARNMYNMELLEIAGHCGKPVMLKRAFSAKIEEEWFASAERIRMNGNENIIMCERGIRTFEPYARNTLDLTAVRAVKDKLDYPVVVDSSHATGRPEMVIPMALAGVACGADGIMVEVHNNPKKALCDGHQALTLEQFDELMERIEPVAKAVGKTI